MRLWEAVDGCNKALRLVLRAWASNWPEKPYPKVYALQVFAVGLVAACVAISSGETSVSIRKPEEVEIHEALGISSCRQVGDSTGMGSYAVGTLQQIMRALIFRCLRQRL